MAYKKNTNGSYKKKGKSKKSRATKKSADKFVVNALIVAVCVILITVVSHFFGGDFQNQIENGENSSNSGNSTVIGTNFEQTSGLCRFDFLDVGQAESTLITTPNNEYVLVDAATAAAGESVVKYLKTAGVEEIDYLILSHPHNDHIGGAVEVLENFDVRCVIMPNAATTSSSFDKLYSALLEKKEQSGCKIYSAEPGDIYNLNECTIKIHGPIECDEEELNNCSVVFTFEYGDFAALFSGDAESDAERLVVESGADIGCNLLKVGHHGSSTSSSDDFLDKALPNVAVISCGKNNTYGHPHAETVAKLKNIGAEIYVTAENGTVTVFTDGEKYSVETEKQ